MGYDDDILYCIDQLKKINSKKKAHDAAIKILTDGIMKLGATIKDVLTRVSTIEQRYNDMAKLVNELTDELDSIKKDNTD